VIPSMEVEVEIIMVAQDEITMGLQAAKVNMVQEVDEEEIVMPAQEVKAVDMERLVEEILMEAQEVKAEDTELVVEEIAIIHPLVGDMEQLVVVVISLVQVVKVVMVEVVTLIALDKVVETHIFNPLKEEKV